MIFIAGASAALFITLIFLFRKKKKTADWLLIAWLFAMALHLCYFYFAFNPFSKQNFYLSLAGNGLIILHTPLLFLYAKTITSNRLPSKWFLHSLWYFGFLVVFSIARAEHPSFFSFKNAFLTIKQGSYLLLPYYGIYYCLVAFVYTALTIK
jgi:hypothetical protein